MKRRGAARVVGIDCDRAIPRAGPARGGGARAQRSSFASSPSTRSRSSGERFDIVHLHGRALPPAASRCSRSTSSTSTSRGDLLVFQSMQRGSPEWRRLEPDYPFSETAIFDRPDYPRLDFIERKYSERPDELVGAQSRLRGGDAAQRRASRSSSTPRTKCTSAGAARRPAMPLPPCPDLCPSKPSCSGTSRTTSRTGTSSSIPEWDIFAAMVKLAAERRGGGKPGAHARARRHVAHRSCVHPAPG